MLLDGETPEVAAARIVTSGVKMSYEDAHQMRLNYEAKLLELEYDLKTGLVIPIGPVVEKVGKAYARLRTRLLAIPSERAPQFHRLKTVAEVEEVFMGVIYEALEELTMDEI